jgi:hypothetical protein
MLSPGCGTLKPHSSACSHRTSRGSAPDALAARPLRGTSRRAARDGPAPEWTTCDSLPGPGRCFRIDGRGALCSHVGHARGTRPLQESASSAPRVLQLKPIVWPDVALGSNEVTLQLTNQPFDSLATRVRAGWDSVGFDGRLLEGRGGPRVVLEQQPGRASVPVEDLGSAIAGSALLQRAATDEHGGRRSCVSKATCVMGRAA